MEIWKFIDGYNNLYMISNLGRIKSFVKYKEGKILKPFICRNGYEGIKLVNNGRRHGYRIHRLVAQYFITNEDSNKTEVNHKDGNKLNNLVDNLEWCTRSYNTQHAWDKGLNKGYIHNKNPIAMIDKDTNKVLKIFNNVCDACRYLNTKITNRTGILQCCNKKQYRKTAIGYKWSYIKDIKGDKK